MAEKRIDITARGVNSNVTTKEKVTSVSIKQIAANIVKNKQYNTSVPNTRLRVTLTGFGEEAIPNDGSFKRFSNQINQTDFFLKTLFKGFEEPQQITDLFNTVIAYKRIFNEDLNPTNLVSKEIYKIFANELNIDQFSTADIVVFSNLKLFTEVLLLGDLPVYTLNKVLLHNTTNTDITVYTTGKNVLEDQSSIDLFNRVVNYNRIFNDFSSCTDDFCEICPDDDQIATFTKVVKDFPQASDLFLRSYTKPVLEIQSVTDTDPLFAIAVNKVEIKSAIDSDYKGVFTKRLSNEFSFSDFSFRAPQKVIQENLFNSELIVKDLSLPKLEEINNQSLTEILITKPFTSSTNNADRISFTWDAFINLFSASGTSSQELAIFDILPFYNDIGLSIESLSNSLSKPLFSETSNQDDLTFENSFVRIFNNESNTIDNGQIFDFNKSLIDQGIYSEVLSFDTSTVYSDLGLSTEQIANNPFKLLSSERIALEEFSAFKFTNRILEEEVQNSDSGLINNQSYFAEAYTTPGYVGSNTTF
jgi:hypothetical protein